MSIKPLTFPVPWPPPDKPTLPELPPDASLWRRWLRSLRLRFPCWDLALSAELYAIEHQILVQLERRRGASIIWPEEPKRQRIASVLRQACCPWKIDGSVIVHPQDPAILWFWGPVDDLSPLQFLILFDQAFSTRVPRDFVLQLLRESSNSVESPPMQDDVLESRVTIEELVERCVAWLNDAQQSTQTP
jgi:hypothetical protein